MKFQIHECNAQSAETSILFFKTRPAEKWILLHESGVGVEIRFCPWCGADLAKAELALRSWEPGLSVGVGKSQLAMDSVALALDTIEASETDQATKLRIATARLVEESPEVADARQFGSSVDQPIMARADGSHAAELLGALSSELAGMHVTSGVATDEARSNAALELLKVADEALNYLDGSPSPESK